MNTMVLDEKAAAKQNNADDNVNQPSVAPQAGSRNRGAVVRRVIVIVALIVLGYVNAMAQTISITASPLYASQSVAQVTGELKILDNVSVAGVAGYGFRKGEDVTFGGGQVRVYLNGGFSGGLHIGAEALYAKLSESSSLDGMINLMNGTSAGPFVGYKYTFPFGLTFDVIGGIRFSEGRIETGAPGSEDSKLGPLANINVGWTF